MVRYQDKAVVVGVVITAVLGASAGQLHYTVGEIAQIGERCKHSNSSHKQ